jgi:hypothetical protein
LPNFDEFILLVILMNRFVAVISRVCIWNVIMGRGMGVRGKMT